MYYTVVVELLLLNSAVVKNKNKKIRSTPTMKERVEIMHNSNDF